jgi:hypothetical protein
LLGETPQQGIYQVVVEQILAENPARLLLQLIAVLGARKQGRKDY